MGSSKSKPSPKGQVLLQTDRQMYFVNDMIRGIISLNVVQQGFDGQILFLKIVGLEDAKKTETHGSGKNRHTVTYRLKNKFILQNFLIYDFGAELPITQKQFPFEIPLNFLNTTTTNYVFYSNFYCYIRFYISAYVASRNPNKMKEVIKHKIPIIITRPYLQLVRPMSQQNTKALEVWCCISKGTSKAEVKMPVSDFMVGQRANFKLHIDNTQGQLNIENVQVTFQAVLDIKFSGGAHRSVPIVYLHNHLQGIQRGEQKEYDTSIDIVRGQLAQHDLQSSSTSPGITHRHCIQIKITYDGCTCCSGDQIVSVPITVVNPPQIAYQAVVANPELYQPPIQPPQLQDWNPQLHHQQSLTGNIQPYQYDPQFIPNDEMVQFAKDNNAEYNQYHAQNPNYQPINQPQMQDPFK